MCVQSINKLFILLLSLFVISELNPQEIKIGQEKLLKHEAVVTLKLIQIYVTDDKGNPVSNLKKNDFELYDNGKIQTIEAFEKYLLSSKLTENQEQQEIISPISAESSRKFILFFDFAFNNLKGILNSKEAALHFIDNYMQPKDQIAVYSYSAFSGFNFNSDLTSNHEKIRKIIRLATLKI